MIGRTEIGRKSPKLTLPLALDLGTGMILAAFYSLGTTPECRLRLNKCHRLLAIAGAVILRMLALIPSTPDALETWSLLKAATTSTSSIDLN